jgi:hypothetical protein
MKQLDEVLKQDNTIEVIKTNMSKADVLYEAVNDTNNGFLLELINLFFHTDGLLEVQEKDETLDITDKINHMLNRLGLPNLENKYFIAKNIKERDQYDVFIFTFLNPAASMYFNICGISDEETYALVNKIE